MKPFAELSLEEIYRAHHGRVLRICYRYLKNWSDAEDAAQNVLLKTFRSSGSFEGLCSPASWIFRIAVNESLGTLRSRKSERCAIERFRGSSDREQLRTDAMDAALDYQKVIANMNSKMRKISEWYCRDGLTQEEISVHLGISRVAITRRFTKLRKKFCEMSRGRLAHPVRAVP